MTTLLDKATAEASRLSPEEQDALAEWLLGGLASERRWQETFPRSQKLLSTLAAEALAEHRRERT